MVQIHLVLKTEEKAMAVKDAHKMEMTLSEYIRFLLQHGHKALEGNGK